MAEPRDRMRSEHPDRVTPPGLDRLGPQQPERNTSRRPDRDRDSVAAGARPERVAASARPAQVVASVVRSASQPNLSVADRWRAASNEAGTLAPQVFRLGCA